MSAQRASALAFGAGWCVLLLALAAVRPAAGQNLLCCAIPGSTVGEPPEQVCDNGLSGNFSSATILQKEIDCITASNAALDGLTCTLIGPGAGGDPHITGFDGSDYMLVGKPNATYNLLSERNHQVNIQLFHPPSYNVEGLFINAVGVMIKGARIAVRLVPGPNANEPAMAVTIYGAQEVTLTWAGQQPVRHPVDSDTTVTFQSPQTVAIASSDVSLSVVLIAKLHLDVHFEEVATSWHDVHGVMGSTYAAAFSRVKFNFARGTTVGQMPTNKVAKKHSRPLEGVEDDYVTSGLLTADDKFSRFVGGAVQVTRKLLAAAGDAGPSGRARCDAGASSAVLLASGPRRSLLSNTFVCRA